MAFLDRLKSISCGGGIHAVLIAAWLLSSILVVIVPVAQWNSAKGDYYASYGKYVEYEQQQEEQNNDNNGNNNNNNNNNGYYYSYKECSWSNWSCRKQQYQYATANGSGDGDGADVEIPNWYIFLGGQTEEHRRRGAAAESTGGETFVYAWTLVMFFTMILYGTYALYKRHPPTAIIVFLAVFAQFALLQSILVSQGVISSDDRELEDSYYGWYGQMGVLIAYTSFWIILFCSVFIVVFIVMECVSKRRGNGAAQKTGGNEYHNQDRNYDAPQVQMTSA
eukprot:CAMPEP_0197467038 /NCGR_PEP_ID=MMETSP1175-20131217/65364_1 /TAXON_ID=1003142 /ORGANISM="Triceratium dubium, Strain CCMP147" /LENGTH=278 /DNA_ID=CAMNT_0043003099 /DNA_START=73 /DNA_END=910 /DNA_ORIENTATION=+